MPHCCIINGTIVLPRALLKNASLLIKGGKIVATGRKVKRPAGAEVIDAKGSFVSPGFIDTHIHGSPDAIFKNEVRFGATSVVIAQSCAPFTEILSNIRGIEEFIIKSPFGRNVLGVRLEGPFINKIKSGAQDKRYISKPDRKEALEIIRRCGPLLKMMTIAPELKGAIPVIKLLKRSGVIASIGHSGAMYDEAIRGISAGISHSTHTFNAMRGPDGRDPGASTAVLSSGAVSAEVIPDLVHVRKELLGILVGVKGMENTILVTDSVRAEKRAGVRKSGGVYKFDSGTIAGSALTAIGALKNCVMECGLALTDAVRMLTINPARLLGVGGSKGRIAPGMDADIVIFDGNFDVRATIIDGNVAYRRTK